MAGYIPAFFIVLMLLALSVCGACVSPLPGPQAPSAGPGQTRDTGLIQITPSPGHFSVSLRQAFQKLREMRPEIGAVPDPAGASVYYVLGRNMGSTGDAESWAFGTGSPEGNQLHIYDRAVWTTVPWTGTVPSAAIPFDRIVQPEVVIARGLNESASTPGFTVLRELELKNGIYSLTLESGTAGRILTFNATTGALIAHND